VSKTEEERNFLKVRFKVLTAVSMKMTVFWDITHRPDSGGNKYL
jgi:hypothetical protein